MSLIVNQNLADAIKKKEEERKTLENKNRELMDKNEKLMKKLTIQLPVQGARHLLWDILILEATKIRPYLNYIQERRW